jgi:hypothetical protein
MVLISDDVGFGDWTGLVLKRDVDETTFVL